MNAILRPPSGGTGGEATRRRPRGTENGVRRQVAVHSPRGASRSAQCPSSSRIRIPNTSPAIRIRFAPRPRKRSARLASRVAAATFPLSFSLKSIWLLTPFRVSSNPTTATSLARSAVALDPRSRRRLATIWRSWASSLLRSWVDRICSTPRTRSCLMETSAVLVTDREDPQPQPSTKAISPAAAQRTFISQSVIDAVHAPLRRSTDLRCTARASSTVAGNGRRVCPPAPSDEAAAPVARYNFVPASDDLSKPRRIKPV